MLKTFSARIRSDLVAYIFFGLSAFAVVSLAWHGMAAPLDYDEAYNLQVVDNLANGTGYASYGALRDEGPWAFDPNITTGPVILLPLALVWWLTDGSLLAVRIAMLSFCATYILGILAFLGLTRETLVMSAVGAASALIILFWPERVIGEVPAAAAIIWAAYGVSKNRGLIAGLGVGLAIQIKYTYGLAGAALLLSWFFETVVARPHRWIRNIALAGAAAAVPTVCFELYRLVSLGSIDDYRDSLGELRAFVALQKTANWLDPNTLGSKVAGLYRTVEFPGWVAVALAAIALWIATISLLASNPTHSSDVANAPETTAKRSPANYSIAAHVGLSIGGLLMLYGWFALSAQTSPRQGLPALLLVLPLLLAACVRAIASGKVSAALTPDWRWLFRVVVGLGLIFLMLALAFRIVHLVRDKSGVSGLNEQRRVAEMIRKSGATSIGVEGWWQNPEFQVLTGKPGTLIGSGARGQLLVFQNYQVSATGNDWTKYKARCSKIIYQSPAALLCWPYPAPVAASGISVVDWGPKSTSAGVVPNVQLDGGAGIWIKIKKEHGLGPVKVLFADHLAMGSYQAPSGDLITASIRPREFRHPGYKDVAIKQLSTGRIFPVGKFLVQPGR